MLEYFGGQLDEGPEAFRDFRVCEPLDKKKLNDQTNCARSVLVLGVDVTMAASTKRN